MKGKLLTNSEIRELENGDKVWVEDKDSICKAMLHTVCNDRLVDINNRHWDRESNSINVYLWVEPIKSEVVAIREISPIKKIEFSSKYGVKMYIEKIDADNVYLYGGKNMGVVLAKDTMVEVHKLLGEMLGASK